MGYLGKDRVGDSGLVGTLLVIPVQMGSLRVPSQMSVQYRDRSCRPFPVKSLLSSSFVYGWVYGFTYPTF